MGKWLTSKDDARCPECGGVELLADIDFHQCMPLWYVGGRPDDYERIHAETAEAAVYEWAWRHVDLVAAPAPKAPGTYSEVVVSDGNNRWYFGLLVTMSRPTRTFPRGNVFRVTCSVHEQRGLLGIGGLLCR